MKSRGEEGCGSIALNSERAPAQEVLDDKAEIFSCGGVYLSQCRKPFLRNERFQYLHLPNRQREVMVLKNHKIYRLMGIEGDSSRASYEEISSTQETLRRFFKESLN